MTFPSTGIATVLAKHGRSLNLTYKPTNPTYNPATGEVNTGTSTTVTIKGYFYNSSKQVEDETIVSAGKRRVVFMPVDTSGNPIPKPKEGDLIAGAGDSAAILRVDEVTSGEKVLAYFCWVRE